MHYSVIMFLHDDSLVMRGGTPNEERWLDAILDAVDEGQEPVLSVFCDNKHETGDLHEVLYRIASTGDIPHGKVSVTTAGKVRGLGLTLEHDPSNGQSDNHFHIVFPVEPSIIEVRELIGVFSEPFPNPHR